MSPDPVRSRTSAAERQRLTPDAVVETQRQRDLIRGADAAARSDRLVQGLRKRLTSLSVLASLMRMGASEAKSPVLVDQADRTSAALREMADAIDQHFEGGGP